VRYLILSDIHANRQALEAVAAKTAGRYEQLVCLGDVVGYGADPAFVIDWLREQEVSTKAKLQIVRGNHDKAAIGLANLEWFNASARASALWTQLALSQEHLDWLSKLPQGPALVAPGGAGEPFWLCHGSPLNEDEYLSTRADVQAFFGSGGAVTMPAALFFFGHTHVQGGFLGPREDAGPKVRTLPPVARDMDTLEGLLNAQHSYLINPGAVGQPRDRDPRAAYAMFDSESRVLTYERAAYDIGAAQQKILAAGLPQSLAARLALGR
jgi:predicted phosphodiesterase